MTSIYQKVLGSDFNRLHPRIQERFGFSSADHVACIGRGTMHEIWHGRFYTLPFLYVGSWRRIMFPERGANIPFSIENYAFQDPFGRETVTWMRQFKTRRNRRFDAYMIYSEQRGCIVDYLGTHQHLAVDIDLSVDEKGGLKLRSGAQRFYEGWIGFSFPLIFSGIADVNEWFDEKIQKFASKSASVTAHGGRCSDIEVRSRRNGCEMSRLFQMDFSRFVSNGANNP